MITKTVTADNLNDVMEFDTVIQVHANGQVTFPEMHAPELYAMSDADGSHLTETDADLQRQAKSYRGGPWTLETGWTGQHGYSGPCFHQSEFVGGALATHILETPGYWVALVIYEDDGEPECWAVAYKELPAGLK